jgi:hypothetical protein
MFPAEKMVFLVFTSYPYAVQGINKPEDIPENYYTEVADKMPGKPFGFSELGWTSMEFFGGEEGQMKFLELASMKLTRDKGVNLKLFAWAWLHDINAADKIGLKKRDRQRKRLMIIGNNYLPKIDKSEYCKLIYYFGGLK